jgi:hypothetical protein
MKVLTPVLMMICLVAAQTAAQETQNTGWKFTGLFGANLNVTVVSSTWKGDEQDAQSWLLKLEASAERDATKTNWLTTLKEEFGKTKLGDDPEGESSDLIDFDSVFSWKIKKLIQPYVAFALDSYNSEFLDPVTLTESAGIGLLIIDEEKQHLKTRVGAAFRQLIDPIDELIDPATGDPYEFSGADDPNTAEIEENRGEIGAEWITNYDLLLTENSKFTTEAKVFTAFEGGASLRWDNSIYFKIGKYLTLQCGYLVIYDYDKHAQPVWPDEIQTRLTTTLGVSYNLF